MADSKEEMGENHSDIEFKTMLEDMQKKEFSLRADI